MTVALQVLWALGACLANGIVFQLRREKLLYAALGGALGWLVFAGSAAFLENEIVRYFVATLVIALYSELLARWKRTPATVYLIVSILPLVPGGGLYQTMEFFIQGRTAQGVTQGLHTLAIAGALAMGIVLVSSSMRLFWQSAHRRRERRQNAKGTHSV